MKYLLFISFLFLGCCSLTGPSNSGQVVVENSMYHFTYSSEYWREADPVEMSLVKSASQNDKIEKIFYSKDSDAVYLLFQSFDGQSDCNNLNAENMDYAVLNGGTKKIANRTWCVLTGYETTPGETSSIALTNCADKFVIFFLISPDSDRFKADSEFNKLLESFRCA